MALRSRVQLAEKDFGKLLLSSLSFQDHDYKQRITHPYLEAAAKGEANGLMASHEAGLAYVRERITDHTFRCNWMRCARCKQCKRSARLPPGRCGSEGLATVCVL
ncbi:hypothetical protein Mapa_008312 [Marchantia paleacea]|nr:hypothetical protein Mapa_008312 [Marchantia paleacea]